MQSILSTKKLKPNQRDLLLGQGFTLVDYNAIHIEFLDFEMPQEIENAIFTSQNGVNAFYNKNCQSELVEDQEALRQAQGDRKIMNSFCVGQKTKALLEENKLKVIESANYGADLAQIIVKNYKNEVFHYFCSEQRRDELPDILKASKMEYIEIKTYKTIHKVRRFDQKWDGILFFSPSGVESYFVENEERREAIPQRVQNDSPLLICIGETTANEARKYSDNIIIANATSVESVIAKTVKTFKN